MRVRLLFAGFLLSAVVLSLIRTLFGEPYPAPFMPPFKGTGLKMVSPTEASVIVPRLTVTFSDGTTTEISRSTLFADIPSPVVRAGIVFWIVPDPDRDQANASREGLRKRIEEMVLLRILRTTPSSTVPADVRQYLLRRLETVYPSRTAASLTIALYRETFPVSDIQRATYHLVGEKVIPLP